MVQRICSRLGRYDYKDVCRELANKRNKGRLLTNMPTEHEVIEMIGRAPWSTAIATVVDGTFRTRRTVYMYADPRGNEDSER
jgi:hypothetical protein